MFLGSVLEFQTKNGVLVGKKSDPAADPIVAVTGIIELTGSVDEYLTDTRGQSE